MRSLVLCVLISVSSSLPLFSQRHPGGTGTTGTGTTGTSTGTTNIPIQPSVPDVNQTRNSVYLSGKVVVDDGSELTEPASVQSICGGQRRNQAYTDRKGRFSFEFGNRSNGLSGIGVSDAATSSMSSSVSPKDWQGCELQAVLPGFSSDTIELSNRITGGGMSDVGRIVLHRLAKVEGLTLSATSAAAPSAAKKALEKGREDVRKNKLDAARQSFQKAVEIYPQYALAWCELGRLQLQDNQPDAARASFDKAVAADAKYVNPYVGLSQIALKEQKWQEVVNVTGKLLALDPVSFPDAWFYNGVGNYQLHDLDAAEKSARRGVQIDTAHHTPKIQYLLGMVLAQKHQYQEATQYMQQYLQLSTAPADIAEAQKQLAELQRSMASAVQPGVEQKK